MLSDSIWRPERFFWLGSNYAVVWQEDLWNYLLRFATLQNGLEVLNIEDFRLWRFCESAKGVLSKHSTSLLDSTDSVLSLYPMLRCSVQAGIGVRTPSSCLDCHILPPSHVSQLNANRLYIVCLFVARVGSQTLIPWWRTSSVHELQQAVFLPLYVSRKRTLRATRRRWQWHAAQIWPAGSQNMPKETERD